MKIYYHNKEYAIDKPDVDILIFMAGVYYPYDLQSLPLYDWKLTVYELITDFNNTIDYMFGTNDWFDWDGGYGNIVVEI